MRITNAAIVSSLNFLNSAAEKTLPQKISFAIAKNIKFLSSDYTIYKSQLEKITETYKDFLDITEGKITAKAGGEDAVREIQELLQIENDIEFYKIPQETFDYDDTKYDPLSAKDLIMLQSILCEE